jgi:hypothetical protein
LRTNLHRKSLLGWEFKRYDISCQLDIVLHLAFGVMSQSGKFPKPQTQEVSAPSSE